MDTAGPVSVTDHAAERATLRSFRAGLYGCLTRRADALFELADTLVAGHAVATAPPPHLSLEPAFRRGWGSTYGALRRGRIAEAAVRDLLAATRPASWPGVFAVDASSWARCDAECSPERGYYHHPSRHSAGQPIVAGWNYSWIAQLNWQADSWTAPLDVRRMHPSENAGRATAGQVAALVGRLGADGSVPLFVFDAGYDPIALSVDLAATRAQILVRIRSDRVFFPDPEARPAGMRGRPRRHGERFACADPASWPAPATALTMTDSRYGRVEVQAWHGLHPRLARRGRWAGEQQPPIVIGSVIRVVVEHLPKPTARAMKTLWLWWSGPGAPDLDVCWRAYIHRFDIEHTLRFVKHTHRLDHAPRPAARTGRPLDLARGRRLHGAAPRPPSRRRLPPALGAPAGPRPAHPDSGPPGFSSTGAAPRHPGQSAETHQGGTGTAQGQSPGAGATLPGDQEGRLTVVKLQA